MRTSHTFEEFCEKLTNGLTDRQMDRRTDPFGRCSSRQKYPEVNYGLSSRGNIVKLLELLLVCKRSAVEKDAKGRLKILLDCTKKVQVKILKGISQTSES